MITKQDAEKLKEYCLQISDTASRLTMDLISVGDRLGERGEELDLNKDALMEYLRALHFGVDAMNNVMFDFDADVTKAENMADAFSGKKAGA